MVTEVHPEKKNMVMRTAKVVAVLTAGIEANRRRTRVVVFMVPPQLFDEQLQVSFNKGSTSRKMCIIVGERDEAGELMQTSLVHAPQRPLPRLVNATAETLAAGDGHRKITIALLGVEGNALATGRPVPLKGTVAGHESQPDTAAHWIANDVLFVSAGSRGGKLTF